MRNIYKDKRAAKAWNKTERHTDTVQETIKADYVFWGAGRIGAYILRLWKGYGCSPLYFVDQNSQLWGTSREGVAVCAPDTLCSENKSVRVLITCGKTEEAYGQLLRYGIEEERIIRADVWWKTLPTVWEIKHAYGRDSSTPCKTPFRDRVLFDLQNGLVLGGVEMWSFQTARLFRAEQIQSQYLITDSVEHVLKDEEQHAVLLRGTRHSGPMENVSLAAGEIMKRLPCAFISNFVGYHLFGACYAKHMSRDRVRLIAVIHNDEEIYYDAYMQYERYIDFCLIISRRMKEQLLQRGFPEGKIRYLPWILPCEDTFSHTYSTKNQTLRIGYAGRVTIRQKRMDLLWETAWGLAEQGIDFRLEIAGHGDYLDTLKKLTEEKGLRDNIHFLGLIPREEISAFWKRQDIMVSCSDYEGHSISQGEAMAAGAVPVITDVSGALDDVEDGVNGFVVRPGSTGQLIEKLSFLYHHRELLPRMGERAYQIVKERNNEEQCRKLWEEILS